MHLRAYETHFYSQFARGAGGSRQYAPVEPDPFDEVSPEDLLRRRGRKWTRYPEGVIAAWIADMDVPLAPPIRAALDRMLDDGDVGYPHGDAEGELGEAFAERMSVRHGWSPDPSGVVLTADLVQATSLLLACNTEPGDGVILQTPIYPPFLDEVAALGRRVVPNPLRRAESTWELDIDHLDEVASAPDVGVMLLVNPHNPSGRVLRREELTAIAEVAHRRDLLVISDEIHAELLHPGHRHVPFASLDAETAERTVTLTSASKSFSIAGLRCAVVHFGSDAALATFRRIPEHQVGHVSALGIEATRAAWRDGDGWLDAVVRALTIRRDRTAARLGELMPELGHLPPEATYLHWIDTRELGLPDPPGQWFLAHARVALNEGAAFGPGGVGRVRLNVAMSIPLLDEAIERMVTAVDLWRAGSR